MAMGQALEASLLLLWVWRSPWVVFWIRLSALLLLMRELSLPSQRRRPVISRGRDGWVREVERAVVIGARLQSHNVEHRFLASFALMWRGDICVVEI